MDFATAIARRYRFSRSNNSCVIVSTSKSVSYVAGMTAVFSAGVIALERTTATGAHQLSGSPFIHFISVRIPPDHTAFVRAELFWLLFCFLQQRFPTLLTGIVILGLTIQRLKAIAPAVCFHG